MDEYLTAVQAGDEAEQQRLLKLEPQLAEWTDYWRELDRFADALDDSCPIPSQSTETIQFGKYELRGEIGRGGMGVVFRAFHPELDRHVALKMLTGSSFASRDQRRRFEQEARLASRIRHRNIVAIHDVGEFGGQPYFTMEYIAGSDLAAKLRQGRLPTDQAVQWMIQIARAVDYLHTHGIVHRDLKPSNVLIDEAGNPYLVDFGLARALEESQDPTTTGTVLGTPSYMSPEQAAGRVRDISSRSDVYSLGAILYEMFCGQPPFHSDSPFDTILQVLEREPPPPRRWNRAIPEALEQICLRCLEKSPDARYASANDLAQDLENWSRGEYPNFASRSPILRTMRTIRRHPSAAYRLLALIPTLLIVIVRCLIAPQFWSFYWPVLAGLGFWATLSLVWEWTLLASSEKRRTDIAFLLSDVVCLTAILHVSGAADSSHVTAYFLVIVLAGLSLNRRLVWVAGLACVAGYLCLISWAIPAPAWHVPVITSVLLVCCTAVTDYHIRRLSIWIRPKIDGSDG